MIGVRQRDICEPEPQPDPNAPAHRRKTRALGQSASAFAIAALAIALGGGYAMGGETVLYRFCSQADCADGQLPVAGLIRDGSGNLFGTTRGGGRGAPGDETGSVVFELQPNGNEVVLHSFPAMAPDGYGAQGTLIEDSLGNLYGTTVFGGANTGFGTIFEIAPNGSESVLYNFCSQANCADGGHPEGGALLPDSSGNLYGTTDREGANGDAGTIFRLAPNGAEATLYSFCSQADCADGMFPEAGVIADSAGNLYGTTAYGGGSAACGQGCGTVFRLAPDGTETVLHAFQESDGANPFGSLIMDGSGNLYGTTTGGGDANGDGTIFKVAPNGHETVLHAFQGNDGANPFASLIADRAGNFYGTTQHGGGAANCGVVFKLAPDGTENVLYAFQGGTDGCVSTSGLIADSSGNLYGTTVNGGGSAACDQGCGTVFKLANAIAPLTAQVQPPINADGSSIFNAKRGVVPVIFTLTVNGQASCDLPQATISVTRTGQGGGTVDESEYEMQADNGSYFRISDCQWIYNLNSKALGAGTYQIGLSGDGVTGTAAFGLK